MPSLPTTPTSASGRPPARIKPKKIVPNTRTQRGPTPTRSRQGDDHIHAPATEAVATAFAQIVAERYPGTSWLPVKSSRKNNRFVVPAGKVIRLLPGPADMDTRGGIGHPATPTAH